MLLKHISIAGLLLTCACATAQGPIPPIASIPDFPASAFAEDEAVLQPGQLREDLIALYAGLKSAHYDLYARRSKPAYDALYRALLADFDKPMRPSEAAIIFQRFAAFGNIAHARLDAPNEAWARFRKAGGAALPIYPRIRDGRLFVAESYAPGIAPGDEIIGIEGQGIDVWLQRLSRNVSGDNAYLRATLLELGFPSTLWMELGAVDEIALTLRTRSGETRQVRVKTIDSAMLKERSKAVGTDLFALDTATRRAEILDGRIAYLQPGPFYSVETPDNPWDTAGFWKFIDESFETFLAKDARALIIDMRQNPGGDASFSDRMIAWFADEPFSFSSRFRVRSSPQSQASNQARIALNPKASMVHRVGWQRPMRRRHMARPLRSTFPSRHPAMVHGSRGESMRSSIATAIRTPRTSRRSCRITASEPSSESKRPICRPPMAPWRPSNCPIRA